MRCRHLQGAEQFLRDQAARESVQDHVWLKLGVLEPIEEPTGLSGLDKDGASSRLRELVEVACVCGDVVAPAHDPRHRLANPAGREESEVVLRCKCAGKENLLEEAGTRTARSGLVALLVIFAGATASAHSGGVSGYSGKTGATCTSCHSTGSAVTVALAGPTSVTSGSTISYTLTNSGAPLGGLDVSATAGTFAAGQGTQVSAGEITHNAPLGTSPLTWTFNWTAPTVSTATTVTMYAASIGNGYSGDTGTTTKTITVTPAAPAAGPSFQLSVPATATTHVGQPVTLPITISSSGGFSGPVTLSISGLPTGVTAAWSANPVTIVSGGTATVNATFTVNSVSAALRPMRSHRPFLALSLSFIGVMFGSVMLTNSRNARQRGFWLALGLVLLIGLLMVGCGGSKGSPTSTTQSPASSSSTGSAPSAPAPAPQNFMVTVTGASGSIQQSGTVSVTVN